MIIKALLLGALGCAALLSMRNNFRTLGPALRRMGVVLLLAAGALSVLFPERVTALANALGVGRGTDLVVYVLAVASLFTWIGTYRRLHELEDRFVALARSVALDSPPVAPVETISSRDTAASDPEAEDDHQSEPA